MSIRSDFESESINRYTLQVEYLFARGERKTAFEHIEDLIQNYQSSSYIGRLKCTLGGLLINEDRIYEAENVLKEAEIICRSKNDFEGLIKVLLYLAHIVANLGQIYDALETIREAIDLCSHYHYFDLLPLSYYYQARFYWNLGELKIARNYSELGISQLENAIHREDHIVHWRLYVMKGVIYRAMGESYLSVLECYQKAENIAFSHFLIDAFPTIFNNLSTLLKQFGKVEAKYYLEKCIQISEELNNSSVLSVAYGNMAEIYADQGKYLLAHSYFEKSLALKISLGYKGRSKAYVYMQFAILERNFGHFTEAIEHFNDALKDVEYFQNNLIKAKILAQFAITLLGMRQINEAATKIKLAKDIMVQQQREFLPILYIAEGLYFLIREGPEFALEQFFKAYNIANSKSIPQDTVEASLYIIKCYLSLYSENYKIKNFLQAQKYIEEALEIAKFNNLYPQLINIELLKGGFHLAEYNYGEALKIIVDAINKANELGFKKESDDGRRFIQQINLAIRRIGSLAYSLGDNTVPDVPYFQTGALISYINKLINIPDQEIVPNNFILITFKFTNTGPEPIFMHPNTEEYKANTMEFILNLGVLLTYLMGQGQNYFRGLYGPIPIKGFEKINNSAIIYADLIYDSQINSQDARMEGHNYTIFCFVYPQAFDNTFISRIDMHDIFLHFKKNHKDLALWTDDDLQDLRTAIIDLVVKSHI
jgi:tetratricopeptide (TPR) repeat protein